MRPDPARLRASVIDYCAAIGTDPLLVQGAGGNVSWKDDDTLWIKASGTWLAEAADEDIFVPVDLPHLRAALDDGDFDAAPKLRGESPRRPSIETSLHGLMRHRVVIHLHALEALAHLVRDDCEAALQSLLGAAFSWVVVDYHKPGAALSAAVSAALAQNPAAAIVFLKNHGVVIGGADVAEVQRILDALTRALQIRPAGPATPPHPGEMAPAGAYVPVPDPDLHRLACDADLFSRVRSDWVLYPDHVVFLGARPCTYDSRAQFEAASAGPGARSDLVFIQGEGVFVRPVFNLAQFAQLRCYYDVLVRQEPAAKLRSLSDAQIAELLDWDAEQYRMRMAK